MNEIGGKIAVVTGASSGIGAATARALRRDGWNVVVGARRLDRLVALAAELDAKPLALDVSDEASVTEFVAGVPTVVDLLVNNAGAALGLDSVESASELHWRQMWETNVLGAVRMTRGLLPSIRRSECGHIVNVGSIAGFETYPGGGGYTASKHALRAVTRTLRLELLGEPIRVTEVAPGLVETEFSIVRFGGDTARAEAVYRGMTPLSGADVADCIAWAASRPPHVNIDEIVVRPRDQATARNVHRRRREDDGA